MRVAVTLEQCWHRVPGGTATATLSTLEALAAHGDVRLVGVAGAHLHPPRSPFVPSVPVQMLPLWRPLLYSSWQWLRRPRVERATGAVDVTWASGVVVPPPSGPLVVTVHDLAWLFEPELCTRRGLRLFRRALALTRRDASVVVCPSEATAGDCEAAGIACHRLRVVPWGVPSGALVGDEEVAGVRARRGLRGPYVLWVGTVEPRKNLSALVRAWRRLHDAGTAVELVLVGPQGWHEDLDHLLGADRTGIHVLGFVPPDELAALYRGAEVFCYPSRREGFGLPVLEAMAQGTPVVTSSGTATAEVAGDDRSAGILVDPDDVAGLARAIDEIVSSPEVRERLGSGALERSRSFSWRRTAEGMLAAFEEARRHGQGAPRSQR